MSLPAEVGVVAFGATGVNKYVLIVLTYIDFYFLSFHLFSLFEVPCCVDGCYAVGFFSLSLAHFGTSGPHAQLQRSSEIECTTGQYVPEWTWSGAVYAPCGSAAQLWTPAPAPAAGAPPGACALRAQPAQASAYLLAPPARVLAGQRETLAPPCSSIPDGHGRPGN